MDVDFSAGGPASPLCPPPSRRPRAPAPAVILVKAALQWQAEHDALPKTAADRAAFKDLIRSWQRPVNDMPVEVRCMLRRAVTCCA